MNEKIPIITEPIPICPECGEPMKLRQRHADAKYFWGCSSFPNCRGLRNINPDGTPEEDEPDDNDMSWHPGWPGDYGDR